MACLRGGLECGCASAQRMWTLTHPLRRHARRCKPGGQMNQGCIETGRLLAKEDLNREALLRRRPTIEQSIRTGDALPDGWQVKRAGKTRTRLIQKKGTHRALKDKVWTLLLDFGVDQLSSEGLDVLSPEVLTLEFKARGESLKSRRIDVLATEANTAFIVVCMAREKLGEQDLRQDILEYAADQDGVRQCLRTVCGTRDLRCVFVIATENIDWSPEDLDEAKKHDLVVWDEYDLLSMQELIQLAGEGAKYLMYN